MASKSKSTPTTPLLLLLLLISIQSTFAADPVPATWPLQFHSVLSMNNSGTLQVTDLWYDFPNGRNFNIIQNQLGDLIYDLEWDNGTSFVYTDHGCKVLHFPVGVLRPNFLDDAKFLGQKMVDGFVCNGWEKVDFIWYYEDVETKRPVYWEFFNGMVAHVMTFEVGAVLEDAKWQAPMSCFGKTQDTSEGFTKSKNTSEGFTKSKNTSEGFTESKDTGFSRAGKFMREPASTFAAAL